MEHLGRQRESKKINTRDNKKSTAKPCFLCALSVGASAPNPDTKDFSRKVLWNLKSFTKIKWCSRCEVLWHTFLRKKGVEKSFGISKVFATMKWCSRCEVLWHTFLRKKGVEKSFGISKAFATMKWCVRWEILWLTFLIRKVSLIRKVGLFLLLRRRKHMMKKEAIQNLFRCKKVCIRISSRR